MTIRRTTLPLAVGTLAATLGTATKQMSAAHLPAAAFLRDPAAERKQP